MLTYLDRINSGAYSQYSQSQSGSAHIYRPATEASSASETDEEEERLFLAALWRFIQLIVAFFITQPPFVHHWCIY